MVHSDGAFLKAQRRSWSGSAYPVAGSFTRYVTITRALKKQPAWSILARFPRPKNPRLSGRRRVPDLHRPLDPSGFETYVVNHRVREPDTDRLPSYQSYNNAVAAAAAHASAQAAHLPQSRPPNAAQSSASTSPPPPPTPPTTTR